MGQGDVERKRMTNPFLKLSLPRKYISIANILFLSISSVDTR